MNGDRPRIKFHRKVFHMSWVWVPILYYRLIPQRTAVVLAALAFVAIALWELVRLTWPRFNELCLRRMHLLFRPDERKSPTTSTYYALAIFLAVAFFDKDIATSVLIFLAVGDPMAALIGAQYGGRVRFLGKSFQGSAACFIACFVPASLLVGIWLALWGALSATLFELLSSRINDNLSIPFFSGLVMTLLRGGQIQTPLQVALVLLRVYLVFVVLTCLAGIGVRHFLAWKYRRDYPYHQPDDTYTPSISILKPLRGVSDDLHDNLTAFCRLDYPGQVELVFCAEDPGDPGLMVARLVMEENPRCRIRIVQATERVGRHDKINNLIAAMQAATGEVILVADADVRPRADDLQHMIAPLADPAVGMTTALPAYFGARNLGAGLKALATAYLGSLIYLPLAYFDRLDTAVGNSFALRREVLEQVGGFQAVKEQIADEHALAREVHRQGYRITLVDRPVRVHAQSATLLAWWNQTRRRMLLLRTYAPQRYPVYLFQSGLFHALLYVLVFRSSMGLWLLGITTLAEIVSMAVLASLGAGGRWTYLWLWTVPLLQLVGPIIWASAYFSRVIYWHGVKYYVEKDGVVTRLGAG